MVQAAESPSSNLRTTFRCSSCFQGFYQYAGGSSPFMSLLPTKLLMNREDITADHRDVPAIRNWWTVDQAVTLRCFTAICQRFPMDLQFHDPVLFWRHRNRECELPYWDTSSYNFRSALQPFEVIQSVVVHFIVLHSSDFYQICAHSSGNAIFYKRTCQRSQLTLCSKPFTCHCVNVSSSGIFQPYSVLILLYTYIFGSSSSFPFPSFLFLGFESCWFWTKCSKQGQN